jgi:hypothetical protein
MNNSHAYTQYSLKPAYALSLIIGLLMAVVSLAGLLFPGSIYPTYEQRDSFLANEVVNLIIGLPVLLGSMWLARGGSLAGLLLWPGALLYILYNYIAYTIGMPLSWISIFYLALVILSAYGLFDLLRNIDKNSVRELLSGVVPIKTAGWVLAVLGSLFILRALNMIVQASMDHITLPTAEIGVLIADMILSTIWIAGGVLLLLRKPLGYASGLGLLFAGSMLFVALILFLLLGPVLTGAPFALVDVIVVFIIGMSCFIPFFLFLRGVLASEVASKKKTP